MARSSGHAAYDVSTLLPQFLTNRRNDVHTIGAALDRGDFGVVITLAHNMCGTGTSFGFPALSAIGKELENLAREKRMDRCRAVLAQLAVMVARIAGTNKDE